MPSPFAFLNSINGGRRDDSLLEKDYVPFLINRSLSYFPDTVQIVNVMNGHPHLDNELQFAFLLNMIRPRKRFTKWTKPDQQDDLLAVAQYYGYGLNKAQNALDCLSTEQLDIIKEIIKSESDSNDRRKQHDRDSPS